MARRGSVPLEQGKRTLNVESVPAAHVVAAEVKVCGERKKR